MRAVLSGRGAAIRLRAVPLSDLVYQCLVKKEMVDGADDELMLLGRSLGYADTTTATKPDNVLSCLLKTLVATDGNGNAIAESIGLHDGVCAQGIVADEVHIPVARDGTSGTNAAAAGGGGGANEENDHAEQDGMTSAANRTGYESLTAKMRAVSVVNNHNDDAADTVSTAANKAAFELWRSSMKGSLMAGFQLGLRTGPICEEPVHGVLIVLEGVEVALQEQEGSKEHDKDNGISTQSYSLSKPLSGGMVVAALKQGIRCALLSRPARLIEGHLRVTMHSSMAGLGSLGAVLSKRRGKVLEDSMVDGTDLLLITATLPQAESFGLAPELLQKTSGEVTVPELTFWKWERLDEDPFWIPTSLEEREDFGEILRNGDWSTGIDNTAIRYIRKVRARKGLLVDSHKTVLAAEKQRTKKR